MLRNLVLVLALVLLVSAPAVADDLVDVTVESGRVTDGGNAGELVVTFSNGTPAALRIVGIIAEYDTVSGSTLTFTAMDVDVRVPASDTLTQTITFATEFAEGEFPDFTRPYSLETVVGVNLPELTAAVDAFGDDLAGIQAALNAVNRLVNIARSAESRYPERLEAISERDVWFNADGVVALRPALEAALCSAYAASISAVRNREERVDRFREVQGELLGYQLYHDCLGEEALRAAAGDFTAIGRVQDALVLIRRTDDGEIPEEWQQLYVDGHLAIVAEGAQSQSMQQFRPALRSLNVVLETAPDDARLETAANNLLRTTRLYCESQIAEQLEMEAWELLEFVHLTWRDHPEVQTMRTTVAAAMVEYGIRATENDRPTRANNAYVRGEEHFADVEAWTSNSLRLQQARTNYYLGKIQEALDDGHVGEAQEAMQEILNRRLPTEGTNFGTVMAEVVQARWGRVAVHLEDGETSEAFALAEELADAEGNAAILGDQVAETFLTIGEAIWDANGIMGASFAGKSMEVAERALERGRDANPERADELLGKIAMSRWIIPAAISLMLLIGLAVFIVKGSWRKRMKAKGLWRAGVRLAAGGDHSDAAQKLEKAYELIGFDDRAAVYVGEESRGHMVLLIAQTQQKRGRKDQVELWEGEWRALDDHEKPLSKDFNEAMEQFRG